MAPDGYDGPDRRTSPRGRRESDARVVGWRLGQLEVEQEAMERRLADVVTRAELDERFKTRDALLARDFIPRAEMDVRRDWMLRLYALGLTVATIIEPFVLRR